MKSTLSSTSGKRLNSELTLLGVLPQDPLKNTFPEQIIYVPEMTAQEKLVLFNKIFPNKSHASIEETKAFLSKIPPFPLDVSTAAHYFKSTDISYHKYQESMHADIEQFSKAQANILQDRGNYTKTRYSIVGLSIKNLLNERPDFGDLLLLLSLIDTQIKGLKGKNILKIRRILNLLIGWFFREKLEETTLKFLPIICA